MSRKPSFFNPRRQDNWSGWSRLLALNEQRDPLELSWQVCRWLVITCSQLAKQTIALHGYQTLITIAALNCTNLQRIIANEKKISLFSPFQIFNVPIRLSTRARLLALRVIFVRTFASWFPFPYFSRSDKFQNFARKQFPRRSTYR